MNKDFKNWSELKYILEEKNIKQVNNGEFWLFYTGVNLGGEMSVEKPFVRHCMILKSNLGGDLILIIPISTKINSGFIKNKFYKKIENFEKYGLNQQGYFVLNQVKIISSKRLLKIICGKSNGGKKYPKYNNEKRLEMKKFISKSVIGL